MDRLLEESRTGPVYLSRPEIAEMVVSAIYYNAEVLGHYILHAFVIMPNHVHLLVTPLVTLAKLTRSLKGITSKRGNEILGLTGKPFWQAESYDHTVRNRAEFSKIKGYIEYNPVRAGLASEIENFEYSSAARGPRADRGSALPRHVLS
jgi:REP element-mobilizing transposase RayT